MNWLQEFVTFGTMIYGYLRGGDKGYKKCVMKRKNTFEDH